MNLSNYGPKLGPDERENEKEAEPTTSDNRDEAILEKKFHSSLNFSSCLHSNKMVK